MTPTSTKTRSITITNRMIAAIFQPSQSQQSVVCLLAGGRADRCSKRCFNSRISLSFSSRSSSSCSLTSMCFWMLVMASERHWACCHVCGGMGILNFVSERGRNRERETQRERERENTTFIHSCTHELSLFSSWWRESFIFPWSSSHLGSSRWHWSYRALTGACFSRRPSVSRLVDFCWRSCSSGACWDSFSMWLYSTAGRNGGEKVNYLLLDGSM